MKINPPTSVSFYILESAKALVCVATTLREGIIARPLKRLTSGHTSIFGSTPDALIFLNNYFVNL